MVPSPCVDYRAPTTTSACSASSLPDPRSPRASAAGSRGRGPGSTSPRLVATARESCAATSRSTSFESAATRRPSRARRRSLRHARRPEDRRVRLPARRRGWADRRASPRRRLPRGAAAPRRCEKPPVVRVRFALATPDDPGATAASLFAAKPPGVPNGSATRVPTLSAPPFPGSTAEIYAARARAAAGSPPTTLRAAPGAATLFHTLRSLAAAATTAARNAGDGEDNTANVVVGSMDHDRWFARSVPYDVRAEGLPGITSTAEEILGGA